MTLTTPQRAVMIRMAIGAAASILLLAFGAFFLPAAVRPADAGAALRWLLVLVAPLLIAIAALARHRFVTPADIDGSGLVRGSDRARVLQSIVQNTLEQTVVAAVTCAGWAMTMPAERLGAIPVATCTFVIGRALFAEGYASGAGARALGFALTFYPTLLMWAWALATLGVRSLGG